MGRRDQHHTIGHHIGNGGAGRADQFFKASDGAAWPLAGGKGW